MWSRIAYVIARSMQLESGARSQYYLASGHADAEVGRADAGPEMEKPSSSGDWVREAQRMTYRASGSFQPFRLNCPILKPFYGVYLLGFSCSGCGFSRQPRELAAFALEMHTEYLGRVIDPDTHQDRCTADLAIFDIVSASGAGIDAELQWLSAPGTSIFDRV